VGNFPPPPRRNALSLIKMFPFLRSAFFLSLSRVTCNQIALARTFLFLAYLFCPFLWPCTDLDIPLFSLLFVFFFRRFAVEQAAIGSASFLRVPRTLLAQSLFYLTPASFFPTLGPNKACSLGLFIPQDRSLRFCSLVLKQFLGFAIPEAFAFSSGWRCLVAGLVRLPFSFSPNAL